MADGAFSFHLTFKDGSNPYVSFPVDEKAHRKALRRWERRFWLDLTMKTTCEITGTVTEWYMATAKRQEDYWNG